MQFPRSLVLVLGLALLAWPAHANIPLPAVFAFNFPFWLGLLFFCVSFVLVIVVETMVLVWRYHQPWGNSLVLIIGANLASTAVGFAFSLHPLEFLAGLVFLVLLPGMLKRAFGWPYWIGIPMVLPAIAIGWAVLAPYPSVPALVAQIYAAMIVAFVLTFLIETLVMKRTAGPDMAWRWSLSANLASYAMLMLLLWVGGFRSGAIADTSMPIMYAVHVRDHQKTLMQLQEIYEWERSADTWRLGSPLHLVGRSASMELFAVEAWAENGDLQGAQDLMALLRRYRQPADWDFNQWKNAEKAIAEARVKAASESDKMGPVSGR